MVGVLRVLLTVHAGQLQSFVGLSDTVRTGFHLALLDVDTENLSPVNHD